MRGVISAIAPAVIIEDATHDIAPGDVAAAAWVVSRYWDLYPAGTIHVAVVDPGVGTARRALAVVADGRLLLAPDNGLLTRVLSSAHEVRIHEISAERYLRQPRSATFHGRDVFAPAAAHLAGGVTIQQLGAEVPDPVLLQSADPERVGGGVRGSVVHIDRFGNLITNIPGSWIQPGARFQVGDHHGIRFVESYGFAAASELCVVIGSAGTAEISVRDGSAALHTGAQRGAVVMLRQGVT
jgi:S-adenosylmethionine hydrolase